MWEGWLERELPIWNLVLPLDSQSLWHTGLQKQKETKCSTLLLPKTVRVEPFASCCAEERGRSAVTIVSIDTAGKHVYMVTLLMLHYTHTS